MRKVISLFLCCIIFLESFVSSGFANEGNFGDSKWGMSPSEVKSIEKKTLIREDENALGYGCNLFGKSGFFIYIFSPKNKLYQVMVGFPKAENSKQSNVQLNLDSMDFYLKMADFLNKKYKQVNKEYIDKLNPNALTSWEQEALPKIDCLFGSMYESKNSRIFCFLDGGGVCVLYTDKNFNIRQNEENSSLKSDASRF
ncbi:MAG: hypothetical protein PUB69_02300 [Desulfovibrionaceae bacterium]|nr:hypothetical protein [Desulfovibrionaceae bacterium]